MQRAVKAALMSAFVFPGAGHLYLRRPLRACLFIAPALVAAAYFAGDLMDRTQALANQVLAGTLPLDPAALSAHEPAMSTLATVSAVVLVACWVGSIIDSFVVAHGARGRTE